MSNEPFWYDGAAQWETERDHASRSLGRALDVTPTQAEALVALAEAESRLYRAIGQPRSRWHVLQGWHDAGGGDPVRTTRAATGHNTRTDTSRLAIHGTASVGLVLWDKQPNPGMPGWTRWNPTGLRTAGNTNRIPLLLEHDSDNPCGYIDGFSLDDRTGRITWHGRVTDHSREIDILLGRLTQASTNTICRQERSGNETIWHDVTINEISLTANGCIHGTSLIAGADTGARPLPMLGAAATTWQANRRAATTMAGAADILTTQAAALTGHPTLPSGYRTMAPADQERALLALAAEHGADLRTSSHYRTGTARILRRA